MNGMRTNLIIVEGLPGSGKSTTAATIANELTKAGRKVVCFDEGDPNHPADYADYDFPDFADERAKILDKWRSFVESHAEDTVYVFNCVFLQNPMCETMMRFGMTTEQSRDYIREIARIIKPLHPIIIYIDQPDAGEAIGQVLDERGEGWLNAVIDYHTAQGYGKEHNLTGYEGYIACLNERRNRELEILRTLDLDCYTISQDMTVGEFAELFASVGWHCPTEEQMGLAIEHSAKSYVVRHNGSTVATINWLGDHGMHWFMKELIVRPNTKGASSVRFSTVSAKTTSPARCSRDGRCASTCVPPRGMRSSIGDSGSRPCRMTTQEAAWRKC